MPTIHCAWRASGRPLCTGTSTTRPTRRSRLVPTDGTRFLFLFLPVPEPKTGKNRLHLDLVSESPEHQSEMVDRLVALGARHVDIGQPSDVDHVVLADPEGNEFCVVLRGDFLATTDLLGAIVFEPADPVVGRFWSEATGWPVVYDQDGDTAIRAPDGRGPFVTFGPPTGAGQDGKEPASSRHRTTDRRRPGCGGRASHRTRSPADRHRTRRCLVGCAGRPRGQRVLRADTSLETRTVSLQRQAVSVTLIAPVVLSSAVANASATRSSGNWWHGQRARARRATDPSMRAAVVNSGSRSPVP